MENENANLGEFSDLKNKKMVGIYHDHHHNNTKKESNKQRNINDDDDNDNSINYNNKNNRIIYCDEGNLIFVYQKKKTIRME